MRHPTDGVLRRMLDEPDGVPAPDQDHAEGCSRCADALAAMRADADRVHAALAPPPTDDVDLDAAWQRLSGASSSGTVVPFHRGRRVRDAVRRPAVAGIAAAVVLAGAGAAAANDWLPIFRTQRVAPIGLTLGELNALPDLAAFGHVDLEHEPHVRSVADAEEAEAATGLELPTIDGLPRGVTDDPEFHVGDRVQATFTFDAGRAEDELGHLPADLRRLDGTRVRLAAGPGIAEVFPSASGAPALLVGRAVAPTASSSPGATFEALRSGLLAVPGIPDEVASALRTFNPEAGTLPLPVPTDRFRTSAAEVGGLPATVLQSRDGTVAGVVWVDGGRVTVVAGTVDVDEVLAVAGELR